MGSEIAASLPVIDFSEPELKPGTHQWNLVKDQVQKALEEYGCFEALFNKVPLDLRKAIFGALEELFDLPLQTKLRNNSKKPFHGYVGQYPEVPLFESMGVDDVGAPERAQHFTNLLWPHGNPNFCKTIQSFSEKVSELDQIIRRMVLEILRVEKYLDEHMDSTNYLLRVMKYKGPQTTETKVGLPSHKDTNTFTILYPNQVDGLEVKTKDGQWIKVKCSMHSFIAMPGESFMAWTNGRVHAPYHRVMMSGNEARYSVALFSIPKEGYMIKAPEALVDEQYPLLFKPFDYIQFLNYYSTKDGKRDQSALQRYFGV